MGDYQQWTAQHAVVHSKLKVLREQWVAAKELTRLKSVPHPSPGAPFGKVMAGLRAWLAAIRARSIVTARFGLSAMGQSITIEAVVLFATQHIQPTDTTVTNMKRTADHAFHQIQEMDGHQAHCEKVMTAKIKELLEEVNNMTKMLKDNKMYEESSQILEAAHYLICRNDEALLSQPEGSAEWNLAYEDKLRMQSTVYEMALIHGKIDQKDKKITALMAQLGAEVARQQVLWDFEFEDVWRAVNAHNRFVAKRLIMLQSMRQMDEAGEERSAKWYVAKTQSLITEFVEVKKSERGKGESCKERGAVSARKKYRLWRQSKLVEFFGIDEEGGAARTSVEARMADLQVED